MNISFKRLFFSAIFVSVLLSSCNFTINDAHKNKDSQTNSSANSTPVALQSLIASSEAGSSITLTSKVIVDKNSSITIDKKLTLYASKSFDMKNSSITISVPSVTLKNLTNVSKVVVEETVGDGDFTITNCDVETVTVNGGGANSGHFDNCRVAKLEADYQDVRIVFENGTHVRAMEILQDCHIYVPQKKSYLDNLYVHKEVELVRLGGCPAIINLVTNSGDNKPKIKTESENIEISKAGNVDSEGNIQEIEIESSSDEIPVPFFETMTEDEVQVAASEVEQASLSDLEVTQKEEFVNVDKSGSLTLVNSSYGIILSAVIPDNVNQVNIYRAEYKTNEFYLIGFYKTQTKKKLRSSISFTDYYVEPDKTYDYYVNYISNQNNNYVQTSEIDSLTATAGKGLLKFSDTLTVNFDSSKFEFSMTGDNSITIHENISSKMTGFYLKRADDEQPSKTVESTIYTLISFTDKVRDLGISKVSALNFVTYSDIGTELELYKVKCNLTVAKKDIACTWTSLPTDCQGGIGFTDNKITFAEEELPGFVENTATGMRYSADLSKIDIKETTRIKFKTDRDYDSSYVIFQGTSSSVPFTATSVVYDEENVTPGSNYKCYVVFATRNETLGTIEEYFTLSTYFVPENGSGEIGLNSNARTSYDAQSQTIQMNVGEDGILTGGYIIPSNITCLIDGKECDFAQTLDTRITYGIMDVSYSTTQTLTLRLVDDLYTLSLQSAVKDALKEIALYPFRSSVYKSYRYTNDSSEVYTIQNYVVEDSLNYVPGLPEPFRVIDEVEETEGE